METLTFNNKEMLAIIKLAQMMAMADGRLDKSEVVMMSNEALRFGITANAFLSLIQIAEDMEPREALLTVALMTDKQKRYITAYLGTMIAIDGDVDDEEVKLWNFVSVVCSLPSMTLEEAISYMDDTQVSASNNDENKKTFLHALVDGDNNPPSGSYIFHSNVHQRYENGIPVKGEQLGCNRDVVIEKNVSGGIGYSVTVNNPDAIAGSWGATPMGTKPMKIISVYDDEIELRGYGYDVNAVSMGIPKKDVSFENYGMTIHYDGHNITQCVIHMIERNVDIDYYIK